MRELVLFTLLGLGTGSLIAGIAISLVVVYRGSGVINIGAGSVAMVAGFCFWALRSSRLGHTFGTATALVITIVFAALVGVVIGLFVFRPLRNATPLAKLISSLGILLVAQGGILLAFGPNAQTEPSILPQDTVNLFGVTIGVDRFILAGIVIVAAVVLWAVYRWTSFGLATRAAAESEPSALLLGLAPERLLLINTVLGCLIASTLGVLAAPLITLDTETLPLLVVPALVAAVFARFTSFGIACGVGLALGCGENLLYYLSTQSWFPTDNGVPLPGIEELLVFAAMIAALFFRGAQLPPRGEIVEQRLPSVPRLEHVRRTGAIVVVLGTIALIVAPFDYRQGLVNSIAGAGLALSLVVVTGYMGQISVMQLALSGVSGFIISHLAIQAGIGFPLGPLLGTLGALVVGVFTTVSVLRVRGVTFAVVTIAAAVAIEQFWFINSTWGAGLNGARVPQPHLLGLNLGDQGSFRGLDGKVPSPVLGICILCVTVALGMLVAQLRRINLGQRMLAVRSNERAAAAGGINVGVVKIVAFGIGSIIAGLAGAMYAYNFGSLSAGRFNALTALTLLALAYIGGIGLVSGAAFAGFLATQGIQQIAFQKWFGVSGTWTVLLAGITLILTLIYYPEGIAGTGRRKRMEKRSRKAAAQASAGRELETPQAIAP